jgi:hypothetical protein
MKTIALGQVIDEATDLETVAMTIDAGSVSVLMRNLTNLYSNPSKAVFREYVSNALDSHVKAGVSTPIEITLPNGSDFEPTFIVKDFGVGLSKQEIVDIYSRYGSSTKRDSNTQIGAFGLGAKSALALTDRFDVVTVKDGVRVEFFVKKNGQGVGVVHFVDEAPTTLPNGVEVRVPMNSRRAADIVDLSKKFFVTWKPNTVKVDGVINSETIYNSDDFISVSSAGSDFAWVGTKSDGGYGSGLDKINFLVGGIVYNISTRSLGNEVSDKLGWSSPIAKAFSEIVKSNSSEIFINLPIGSVELTPSREEMMFTDRTVNTLLAVIKDFVSLVPTTFETYLNTLDRADAVRFYGKMTSYFGTQTAKWQGEVVPTQVDLDGFAFNVLSREGIAMKDPDVVTRINIITSLVGHGYHNTRTLLVIADGTNSENAALLRKNLRDYSASVYGDKNINTYLIDGTKGNAWLELINSVTLDKVLSTAKEYRTIKKSAAQTGTTRTKASYVVWNGGDNVEKVTADLISGSVLYARENETILSNLFSATVNDTYKGGRGNLNGEAVGNLKGLFASKTIVFIPASRSLDSFKKQFPNAVDVNEFHATSVNNVVSANTLESEVMATMARTKRGSSVILDLFKHLSTNEITRIANPVLRQLALEVKNAESRLVALNAYRLKSPLETEKGFALNELLPLMDTVSVYRNFSEKQQKQFVDFVNFVVSE